MGRMDEQVGSLRFPVVGNDLYQIMHLVSDIPVLLEFDASAVDELLEEDLKSAAPTLDDEIGG